MERTLFIWIAVYFMTCTETIPWRKNLCIKILDGYDCSGLALQFVPDEIPDSIKSFDFSFNYLPTLYNSTFERLRNLVSLDLTRCSINFMYEDAFQYQFNLETLILVANPLSFISDNAFSGLEVLKNLYVAQSLIHSFMDIPIVHLQLLETLDLKGSGIHGFDGLENLPLQQLKTLFLDMNMIEKLTMADMKKFKGTSGLEISFKGNNIVDIEPNAFQDLDMGSLDFTGCLEKMNISVLLKGLEGVKTNKLYLGLYEDNLRHNIIPSDLQSFCRISVVDINFQLQHFPDLTKTSFQCFEKIQKIDFTRAHLTAFPSNMSNLSMLSHLVLDSNLFKNVCDIHAANFPKLTQLSMNGNLHILDFNQNCLEPLSHLEELQLGYSNLETGKFCCNKQLTGLKELKLLNLSYNFEMKWEQLPFNATPNLKHLDCTHTKYVLNSSSPFINLGNLQTLNLSFTNLNLLKNANMLKGLAKLQVLNLKGNIIDRGVLSKTKNFDYVPLLEVLVLSACGITEIREDVFKGLANLRNVDLSANKLLKLSCLNNFHSLNQIQLNFASNNITLIDVQIVKGLSTSSSIDLTANPLACNCTNYYFIKWVKENVHKMRHIEKTVCDSKNVKITDVNLQCVFSNSAVGIVVGIAIVFLIVISLLCVVKKIRGRYRPYSRL